MNKIVKTVLALGITSALGLGGVNAATYQIIDKGDVPTLKFTYSQQENNFGEMAISGTDVYNFPVQFQFLDENDFDIIVNTANVTHERIHDLEDIQDEAALRAGNPTANDLLWAVRYLRSQTSSLFQKVGDVVAMTNINNQTQEVTIFDKPFENSTLLTRSTIDFISGITDDGWIYGNGSAPYFPLSFTKSDGEEVTHWVREFTTRGYFSPDKGQTIIPLMPPEAQFGGESAILDMSSNGIAVGFATTEIDQDALDFINDDTGGCADPDVVDDIPFAVCVQNVVSGIYIKEAFKWTLDINGVVSSEPLGHLVTFHVDDTTENTSVAQAVNKDGVIVGYATGWVDETVTEPSVNQSRSLYAVVFKEGRVVDFTEDHGKFFNSRAYDINDKGIAVGQANSFINGAAREKFYYVDTTDLDNMTMILPTDFFNGSSSTARAINENNLIVGEGEFETQNDSNGTVPRRTHGFLYDIAADKFTDLNDLLPCLSNYTIIEAQDINENNEISATAILKVPRRDAKGEIMLDENGVQQLEDVVRAIKLSPVAGSVEDCSKVEEKIKRRGAGLGLYSLFSLMFFGLYRKMAKPKLI